MATSEQAYGAVATLGVVGGGVIGAGWAARALAAGLDVVAWDPDRDGERRLRAGVANAWPALTRVGLDPKADPDRLRVAGSLAELAGTADFVQESAPERLDLKTRLIAEIAATAPADVLIASSTSGLLPSDFQAAARSPTRVLVGHPFNPVYLLPLVELVAGKRTAAAAIDAAAAFYRSLGMAPLKVRVEVPGFLSDRLQEALWRENLHLLNDGVATTAELDEAIRLGPGLRWALMGTNQIFALAGGPDGMRHFVEQFGPDHAFPWTRLEPPAMNDTLALRLIDGTEAQAEGRSVAELERLRDDCLISILEALADFETGAGKVLAEWRARPRS